MRVQDTVGVSLSGLCLVHCLGLPVIIAVLPALSWAENEMVHLALAILALLSTLNAVRSWPGGRLGATLIGLAAAGLSLLFIGALAETTETMERVITSIGATALAGSHIWAWLGDRDRDLHRAA